MSLINKLPLRATGAMLVLAFVAGCPGREVARVDPVPEQVPDKKIPVNANRNIDILFVIDDSGSMDEEQASLSMNFVNFVNVLNSIEGGLPNVHIGVASTNAGATAGVVGCEATGDNGLLQNGNSSCSQPSDRWIVDTDNGTNYSGTLAETFSCIAELGTTGCGFESPLESMRLALNGTNPENAGFIRDDAFLAVVFITDEDDCSVQDRAGFYADPNAGVNDPRGPFSSFRCFEDLLDCSNNDQIREFGAKEGCLPDEQSPFAVPVQEYVDFLTQRKSPGQIIVAGIIGQPEPSPDGSGFRAAVRPNPDTGQLNGTPQLSPVCTSNAGEAAPGIRMTQFIDAFVESTTTTICNENLSDALIRIAELLAEVIGTPCLNEAVTDIDACEFWLEDADGGNQEVIGVCANAGDTKCVTIDGAIPECNGALGVVYVEDGTEPFGRRLRIQCAI